MQNAVREFAFVVTVIASRLDPEHKLLLVPSIKQNTQLLLSSKGEKIEELSSLLPAVISVDAKTEQVYVEGEYEDIIYALALGARAMLFVDQVWAEKEGYDFEGFFEILEKSVSVTLKH